MRGDSSQRVHEKGLRPGVHQMMLEVCTSSQSTCTFGIHQLNDGSTEIHTRVFVLFFTSSRARVCRHRGLESDGIYPSADARRGWHMTLRGYSDTISSVVWNWRLNSVERMVVGEGRHMHLKVLAIQSSKLFILLIYTAVSSRRRSSGHTRRSEAVAEIILPRRNLNSSGLAGCGRCECSDQYAHFNFKLGAPSLTVEVFTVFSTPPSSVVRFPSHPLE